MNVSILEWIALGSLAFTVAAAVIGTAIRLTWWLSEKFAEVKETYTTGLNEHEAKDQERHEDNLARFSAVEANFATIIKNGNGATPARHRARKGRS